MMRTMMRTTMMTTRTSRRMKGTPTRRPYSPHKIEQSKCKERRAFFNQSKLRRVLTTSLLKQGSALHHTWISMAVVMPRVL